jgi:hypothetical protein
LRLKTGVFRRKPVEHLPNRLRKPLLGGLVNLADLPEHPAALRSLGELTLDRENVVRKRFFDSLQKQVPLPAKKS